jgi:hypothetical protein
MHYAETRLKTLGGRSKQFVNPSFLVDSLIKSSYEMGTVFQEKRLGVLV